MEVKNKVENRSKIKIISMVDILSFVCLGSGFLLFWVFFCKENFFFSCNSNWICLIMFYNNNIIII